MNDCCINYDTQIGCYNGTQTVFIRTFVGKDAAGLTINEATVITDAIGTPIAAANGTNVTIGACITPSMQSHVFLNKALPAGISTWAVPSTSASPISNFQITVRDQNGSDVLVRVRALTSTTFEIESAVATPSVSIFVQPLQTLS
jgi:hypothetical protein